MVRWCRDGRRAARRDRHSVHRHRKTSSCNKQIRDISKTLSSPYLHKTFKLNHADIITDRNGDNKEIVIFFFILTFLQN